MWKRSVKIQKFSEFTKSSGNATLAMERDRHIVINQVTVETINCCPQNEKELIAGWIWSNQAYQIDESGITCELNTISYSGNLNPIPSMAQSPIALSIHNLYALTASFQEAALLYKDTGTTHSVAIATAKELRCNMEDIDPNIALYKAMGYQILNPSNTPIVLICSAKVDEGTIKRAASIGASVVISRSAPTDLACDYATNKAMTIIGYARGTRFSIYVDNGHLRR